MPHFLRRNPEKQPQNPAFKNEKNRFTGNFPAFGEFVVFFAFH